MTPHEFRTKWRANELKERSASQSHFNDLCALLGVLDPVRPIQRARGSPSKRARARRAAAVADAYGWGDDWRGGLLTDDEMLARLFRLNQERASPSED